MSNHNPFPDPNLAPDESILLNYTLASINRDEIHSILERLLKVYDRGSAAAKEALLRCDHSPYDKPSVIELLEFTRSLLTTSNSINRVLYQLETAERTDLVALVTGKLHAGGSNTGSHDRQALYDCILIRKGEGQVIIYMPFMPNRTQTSRQFICDLLMHRLIDEGPYPAFNTVHITFTHVHPVTVRSFPRDVDNFNYKPIIDCLGAALGFSDAAWNCSLEKRAEFRDDLPSGVYIHIQSRQWQSCLDVWDSLPSK